MEISETMLEKYFILCKNNCLTYSLLFDKGPLANLNLRMQKKQIKNNCLIEIEHGSRIPLDCMSQSTCWAALLPRAFFRWLVRFVIDFIHCLLQSG